MGTEDNCRQISLTCVESTCSVPVCPHSRHVCFPPLHCSGSRLLYGEWALGCVHFPGPSHEVRFRFRFSGTPQRHSLGCLPSLSEQLRESEAWLTSALSPGAARLLPSPSLPQFQGILVPCTLCLFWGADLCLLPSQQMSTIQNIRKSLVRDWKPVCSLVGDAVSGVEFAPFPSPLPPASSGGWTSLQLASSFLELLSSSFVMRTGPQCVQAG